MSAAFNPPAFPWLDVESATNGGSGMTLRDWFAGQFVMGFRHSTVTYSREHMAAEAYLMADAMLAERARPGGAS